MALLDLVDKISTALDNNEYAIGIFLDLSKAFDTVNHAILLSKLHRYGFQGNVFLWLKSYITDRQQYVYVNNCKSNIATLTCGVAQGSVLGPLLFLLYINDLASVSNNIFPILFADDTNFVLSSKHFKTLINEANTGLLAFSKWFRLNKLSINIKKTNFVLFSGRKKCDPNEAKLLIEGIEINRVSSARFLGVTVDEQCNWKEQIDCVAKKVSKSVGIIRKISSFLNRSTLLTLYYSLIYPYLTYCNLVWANTYPTNLHKLHLLQKRFVRIATNSNFRAPSSPLFAKLKISTIFDINILQISIFIYKVTHQSHVLPNQFQQYFRANSSFHSHATRQAGHLHRPRCNTTRGQYTIKYRGILLWNEHSQLADSSSSLAIFKKKLLLKLIEHQNMT